MGLLRLRYCRAQSTRPKAAPSGRGGSLGGAVASSGCGAATTCRVVGVPLEAGEGRTPLAESGTSSADDDTVEIPAPASPTDESVIRRNLDHGCWLELVTREVPTEEERAMLWHAAADFRRSLRLLERHGIRRVTFAPYGVLVNPPRPAREGAGSRTE